nr:PREDICTED: uncharacterized protein LOC105668604 [Linepithema humile]
MDTKYAITKLNNTNYFVWKFKMQLLLTKEGVWETVIADPPNPETEAWKKKDSLAYATIGLNVEDEQLILIRNTKTAKSAWEALKTYHEKSNANSVVRLIKRLMNMKLEEGADLEMHVTRIAEAFQQMNDIESRETNLTTAVVEQRLLDEWNKHKDKTSSETNGTMALRVSRNASLKIERTSYASSARRKDILSLNARSTKSI